MAKVTETNKILFIDPNDNVIDGITHNPEDLSIAVELLVTYPEINGGKGDKQWFKIKWGIENEKQDYINFFTGKKVGDINILTDFYSDVHYTSSKGGNIKEALCIRSIDITYDSWYLPQVVINFVDVRGLTLMNPSQYEHDNPNDKLAGSFFKSLFSVPFPLFKLQVKGYYGQAVTYDLQCWDVRSTLNSDTGNIDIIAKFVGYTFAFLADVQFNFIKSAPFNGYDGLGEDGLNKYWEDQIKDGRFLLDGITPIPTFAKLKQYINQTVSEFGRLGTDDDDVVKFKKIDDVLPLLKDLYSFFEEVKKELTNSEFNGIDNLNEHKIILEKTSKDITFFNLKFGIFPYGNKSKTYQKFSNLLENFNKYIQENNILTEQISKPLFKLDDITISNAGITTTSGLEFAQQINNQPQTKRLTLDYDQFVKTRGNIKEILQNQMKMVVDNIKSKINNVIGKNLSFEPTIGNILKIIFAHFETFFHTYYSCLNSCNTLMQQRTGDNNGIDIDKQTDLITTGDDKVELPPFFKVRHKNNSKETWVGGKALNIKNPENFPEIEYINEYTKSIFHEQEESAIATTISQQLGQDWWFPINSFDIGVRIINNGIQYDNPYEIFNRTELGFYNLITQIGIRMFYGLGCYKEEIHDVINFFAESEANNIFLALGNNKALMRYFRNGEVNDIKDGILLLLEGQSYNGNKLIELSIRDRIGNNESSVFNNTNQGTICTYTFINSIRKGYSYKVLPLYSETVSDYNVGDKSLVCNNDFSFNNSVPLLPTIELEEDGGESLFSIRPYSNKINDFKVNLGPDNIIANQWNIEIDDSVSYFIDDMKINTINNELNIGVNLNGWSNLSIITKNPIIKNETCNKDIKELLYKSIAPKNTPDSVIDSFLDYLVDGVDTHKKLISVCKQLRENSGNNIDLFKYDIISYNRYDDNWFNCIRPISLFGSLLYYQQNNQLTEITETIDQQKERSSCAKALLFLNCLDIDKSKLNKLFLQNKYNTSSIKRIPKLALLLLGSELWRWDYITNNSNNTNKIDPIKIDEIGKYIGMSDNNLENSRYILFTDINKENMYNNIFFINNKTNKIDVKFRKRVIKVIIKYFKEWVLNEYNPKLEKYFTLKNVNGGDLDATSFSEIITKKMDNNDNNISIDDIKNNFHSDIFTNYGWITKSENDEDYPFFYLFHKPKSDLINSLMNLYKEDVLLINTHYNIFQYKELGDDRGDLKLNIAQRTVESYVNTLVVKLRELLGVDSEQNKKTDSDNPSQILSNEELNLSKYNAFRLLYNKWCAEQGENNFKMENYILLEKDKPRTDGIEKASIKVIDKFYNDISSKYIVDLTSLKNILDLTEINESGWTLLSFLSRLFSDSQMLFVPMPNSIDFTNEEVLKEMFEPFTYRQKMNVKQYPSYVAVYTGKPSEIPSNERSNYKTDALNIYRKDNKTFCDIEGGIDNIIPIPCFAVSYGKQNQSYFKVGSLTNTNPIMTEQSIEAQQQIASSGQGGVQKINTGQNLYSIYSSNSYLADIEMMGCAQIQPLMYFQLFNVYLFTGAYLIYKVTHNITPGKMVTKFTGIKQNRFPVKYPIEFFSYQTLIGGDYINILNQINDEEIKYNPYASFNWDDIHSC